MKNKLRDIAIGVTLGLTTACAPFISRGTVNYHPTIEGCVEGFPVRISYNDDESWRVIRIESPDGAYIEAEDHVTDNDELFDSFTLEYMGLNHPLRKYANFTTLEEIYNGIKSGGEDLQCS